MHLARKMLKLDSGILQTAALDVLVRRVSQNLVQRDYVTRDLMHGISEKGLERATFAGWVLFEPWENARELRILFALGQDLQRKVVVPHVLLVDVEHRQQHVKQITWKQFTFCLFVF